MLNLTLLDAIVILFIAFKIFRSSQTSLGDSLYGLIWVSLIIALFMGLRLTSDLRGILANVSDMMQIIPGLGSKLLVIIVAWYLMHLIRHRLAYWIEKSLPTQQHKTLTRWSEGIRAILLASLITWLIEGWFETSNPSTPLIVKAVRQTDKYMATLLDPSDNRQNKLISSPIH